jgi:putative intracellular protease/amidase
MQVAYLLYDRFTPLDITGPHDVLNSVPGTDSVFVAENAGPVRNEWGTMAIVADRSLDEVVAPDIVVVPGGSGTRLLEDHHVDDVSLHRVALLLAAAGLLDDAPAAAC